mgnify:CR=1 FL=1
MALPDSGQLDTSDVYQERWGDGSSPSGTYTLEQIQEDWNLPETPNDTSIFYGKGRPVVWVDEVGHSETTIEATADVITSGGYSGAGDTEYRYGVKKDSDSSWSWTSVSSVSATYEGDLTNHTFTNLTPDTNYDLAVQSRNIHNNGDWIIDTNVTAIYTDQDAPQNVQVTQNGDYADVTWDDPPSGNPANGYRIKKPDGTTSDVGSSANSLSDVVCGDYVASGETGNVSYDVKALGQHSDSQYVTDSANFDCTTFCLTEGTEVTVIKENKKIEDLEEGDKLLGADIKNLNDDNRPLQLYEWSSDELLADDDIAVIKSIYPRKVLETIRINDGLLEASREHSQLIKRDGEWKFVRMRNVQVGDILRDQNGNDIPIEKVEVINEKKTVYRLTLEEPVHTFYGNGILTHNVK